MARSGGGKPNGKGGHGRGSRPAAAGEARAERGPGGPKVRADRLTPAMEAAIERGDNVRARHPRDRFPVGLVEEALRQSAGVYSVAAIKLGTTYNTIKGYVQRYPYLKEVLAEIEEGTLDLAESNLVLAIKDREAWAVKFYLATKGKRRGYSERHEVTGADGGPVRTAIIDLSSLTDAQLDALDAAARALGN